MIEKTTRGQLRKQLMSKEERLRKAQQLHNQWRRRRMIEVDIPQSPHPKKMKINIDFIY